MKTLYFDLSCGASGDMVLAAIFDLGVSPREVLKQLRSLPLPDFDIEVKEVIRNGIACKQCHVKVPDECVHRHLADIRKIMDHGRISKRTRKWSTGIFQRLAEAEAKVHQKSLEKVHFHEIGAMDSIIDVVGSCVGFDLLNIGEFHTSGLTVGTGTINCTHGCMPVPSPATTELIKDFPVRILNTGNEILTPTGAAIITTLAVHGKEDRFVCRKTGYGAGTKEIKEYPNFLRLWLGENAGVKHTDRVVVFETNLDDCPAEILGYTMERLFAAGVLDVFFIPVTMKKSRPGIVLKVIAPCDRKEVIANIIFGETSSIGIRVCEMERVKLERESIELVSPWGKIHAKKIAGENGYRLVPEFEECRRIALDQNISLRDIYNWIASQNLLST